MDINFYNLYNFYQRHRQLWTNSGMAVLGTALRATCTFSRCRPRGLSACTWRVRTVFVRYLQSSIYSMRLSMWQLPSKSFKIHWRYYNDLMYICATPEDNYNTMRKKDPAKDHAYIFNGSVVSIPSPFQRDSIQRSSAGFWIFAATAPLPLEISAGPQAFETVTTA